MRFGAAPLTVAATLFTVTVTAVSSTTAPVTVRVVAFVSDPSAGWAIVTIGGVVSVDVGTTAVPVHVPTVTYGLHLAPACVSIVCFGPAPTVVSRAEARW